MKNEKDEQNVAVSGQGSTLLLLIRGGTFYGQVSNSEDYAYIHDLDRDLLRRSRLRAYRPVENAIRKFVEFVGASDSVDH